MCDFLDLQSHCTLCTRLPNCLLQTDIICWVQDEYQTETDILCCLRYLFQTDSLLPNRCLNSLRLVRYLVREEEGQGALSDAEPVSVPAKRLPRPWAVLLGARAITQRGWSPIQKVAIHLSSHGPSTRSWAREILPLWHDWKALV